METLSNGYTLEIAPGAFPFSTDSVVLADFARLPKKARVLDFGSGCGTLGMLLCARDSSCTVTGIEIEPTAHKMALKNAKANHLDGRLNSICADFTAITKDWEPGQYDICISNPPYFTAGPLSTVTPLARHEARCSLQSLMDAASHALKFGGDFYLVHKPERLAEIFAAASARKLEPKRLCLLRHKEDGPVVLVLVSCRKGAKPGLLWEESALYTRDGTPTEYYKKLYYR